MEQLKPCPFCNGLAHFEPSEAREEIICLICGVSMAQMVDSNRAIQLPTLIQRWNTRSLPERESCSDECPHCEGTGNVCTDTADCIDCGGSGKRRKSPEERP